MLPLPVLPRLVQVLVAGALLSLGSDAGPLPAAADPGPLRKVDAWTRAHTEQGRVAEFLVVLKDQADLSPAAGLATKEEKGRFVRDALWAKARATQGPLLAWLRNEGVPHQPFYIVNMVKVRAGRAVLEELAGREDVAFIEGNPVVHGLLETEAGGSATALGLEPNIAYTRADQVWSLGFTGQGVVIGGQDTGYDWSHPAIVQKYRGSTGSGTNHDYNWHDAIHSGGGVCGADSTVPCDDHGHGTHTMGTACGDDGGANQIGMAPGARWIGARNMDQGNGTPASYIECFEWFLAPYPVGGTPAQGDPTKAPDVTTNSWACPASEGCSTNSLLLAVQAQRAAGIVTVVAAGNSGSSCSSVDIPPGIYDEVFSVGAHRHTNGNLAGFSSRGPVTADGSNRIKPDICAPGVSVRSSVPGGSYQGGWSGTSMATPHVAGAVALLFSAFPQLKGHVDLTEQILSDTATHVSSSSCSSSGVPNNLWGWGRLDALAAVQAVCTMDLTPAMASASTVPSGTATFQLTVNNTGYIDDNYTVSYGTGVFPATGPATLGPVPAGTSQTFSVVVQVPASASIATQSSMTVNVASQSYGAATAASTLDVTVAAVQPILAVAQPGGPGTGALVLDSGLIPGRVYYNIFSTAPCSGSAGSGPYLGLCAPNLNDLLLQFLLPVGAEPFHFAASSTSATFGPYTLPSGIVVDGICFDFTNQTLGGASAVFRYTVQ